MKERRSKPLLWILLLLSTGLTVFGQGTAADYERASGLKAKYEAAAIDIAGQATWIGVTHRFWFWSARVLAARPFDVRKGSAFPGPRFRNNSRGYASRERGGAASN